MFIIEYKQAGIRVMSQELTQSVLAHYIINTNAFATRFCSAYNHAVLHVYISKLQVS